MRPMLFFLCTVLQTTDLGVNHLLLVFSRIPPLTVRSRRVHIFYTATSGSLSVYRCKHNVLSTNCKENTFIRKRKKRMWRECHPVTFLCTLCNFCQGGFLNQKQWKGKSDAVKDHVNNNNNNKWFSQNVHSCGWSDGFRSRLISKEPTIFFSGES